MKKTVLIVDDSAPMRFLLEAMLGQRFRVYSAIDGLTACKWLSAGNVPDIIVSDVQMPNMDGVELTKNLSANLLYSDIPVILLTAMQLEEVTLYPNVVQLVSKPFDPLVLMKIIDQQLTVSPTVIVAE
ncbi:response regulator [Chitinophaga sp. G-6-1-13]|uniref:Response regulator n=1 Tax=Chitinophaga fulva TaxID=2728842 RepID=A0A848GPV9_9BACT|nr:MULTISPECIES: response regulator [Chitinophaga]MBC9915453.1 response regulator [Chitinophaga varians]NML39072.1 response regulator [Chitinophaga fulva]